MRSRCGIVFVLVMACCATAAYCQGGPDAAGLADLLHWPHNQTAHVPAVVPPAGTVPETDQWPAAAWLDINDVPFVIYAKHLDGYNPETEQGKFAVWLSVPPEHRRNIEQTRPFTAADAHAYLRSAGVNSLTAELYVGPGDRWGGTPPGSEAWTSTTDRLLVAVVEPAQGFQQLPAFGLMRILADGNQLRRLRITCRCPRYDDGQGRTDGEEWIAWRIGSQVFKVDQWGLPDNSPVPGQQPGADPAPPATAGPGLTVPPTAVPFVGMWMDQSEGLLLSVFGDGTWGMFNTQIPQSTPRAGTWGVVNGRLTLRTCLSSPSQLWQPRVGERTAQQLTGGQYDLTMVYDLDRHGEALAGVCHCWSVTAPQDGQIEAFMAWNDPGNSPSPVMWTHVHRVYPPIRDAAGQLAPATELQRMLEGIPPTGIGLPAHKQARDTAQAVGDAR